MKSETSMPREEKWWKKLPREEQERLGAFFNGVKVDLNDVELGDAARLIDQEVDEILHRIEGAASDSERARLENKLKEINGVRTVLNNMALEKHLRQ